MAVESIPSVNQFPWGSLIPALVGLVGVIGGAFLASLLADKRWEKQITFESRKERKSAIRDKGEELHILLSKWHKYVGSIHIQQLMVVSGKLQLSDHYEHVTKNSQNADTHDRLEALLFLYFPELTEDMNSVRKTLSAINSHFDDFVKGRGCLDNSLNKINEYADEFDSLIEKMKIKIRNKIVLID